jgi:hypothetical protein
VSTAIAESLGRRLFRLVGRRPTVPSTLHPWLRLAAALPAPEPMPEVRWFRDQEAWVGSYGYRVGPFLPVPHRWLNLGVGQEGLLLEEGWGPLTARWPRVWVPYARITRAVLAARPVWPEEAGLNLWIRAQGVEPEAREHFRDLHLSIRFTSPAFHRLAAALERHVELVYTEGGELKGHG